MTTKTFTDRIPATDDVLGMLGLQQQRAAGDLYSMGIGAFALGLVVGSALALLYAPRPGRDLRKDVGERLSSVKDRVSDAIAPAADTVRQTA
ncbi:MAG TPA: YtxH domain-containing protein [Candidatus Binatia bacterium]|jgi:hypothetical protein|nr:YtxH domain-containing protein [Candidatus Binatia bacterium]